MYKAIICFDLDGTLLDERERIRKPDMEILENNRDYLFVPATGRSYESVKRLFHQNQLFVGQKLPLPLITMNGAVAFAPQEEMVVEFLFTAAEKQQIRSVIEKNQHISYLMQGHDNSYLLWPNEFGLGCLHRYNLHYTLEPMPESFEFFKVMCFCGEPDVLQSFVDSVKDLPVEKAYGTPFIYEFTPPGVNKGRALTALAETMNVSHLPIFAAGDGGNDVETFRVAKRSFAPKGSLPFVLDAADEVIEPDGVGLLSQMIERSLN